MGTILIQIVFYQLLFLALYEVLLKRDTHYNLQRFYLLLLPVLALFLPFMVVPVLSEGISETYQVSMPVLFLGETGANTELVGANANTSVVTGYSILLTAWALGAVLSSIWVLWKYRSLLKLRASANIVDKGNYKLATLPNTDIAFSFGSTIYLGEELEEEAKEIILKHEKVHVTQKHSIDLVLYQLLRIVFWWNPILYLFQNRLQAVHEFIADAEVVAYIKKKDYYQSLLSQVFKTNGISFTNTFYKQSLIKKRIIMLQKIKSPRKSKFKYLLVLPLLAFMLVVVSCTNDAVETPALTEEETSVTEASTNFEAFKEFLEKHAKEDERFQEMLEKNFGEDGALLTEEVYQEILDNSTVDDVPFAVIEKTPVFPGCEGDSEEDLRNCMNQKINEFVASQFNTGLGKDLGLEGVQTIQAMFTIDKSGNISNLRVRGPHDELEKETRRVLDLLPQFTPGEHRGNKVGVTYTLPIRFEVSSNK